jgi:RsiW-degrading membrane proteinase PrsW (M82 family)
VTDSGAVVQPRKWLGPRGAWWLLLIGGATLIVYIVVDLITAPHYAVYRELPTMSISLGALLGAVCVFYAMLYRLRPGDGVTIARLFAAVGIAAIGTTLFAAQLNGLIARWAASAHLLPVGQSIGVVSTLFAGPVEETLKALTVLFIGLRLRTKTFRGGLFVGGAVGLGFAAMENLQYITTAWEHPALHISQLGMVSVTVVARTVITPLLHPIFTALIGGVLFGASRNGRYRLSGALVGTYFAVVGVHSLWDSIAIGITSLRGRLAPALFGGLALISLVLLLAILIALPLVWRAVARHADVVAGIRGSSRPPAAPPSSPPDPGWTPPGPPAP